MSTQPAACGALFLCYARDQIHPHKEGKMPEARKPVRSPIDVTRDLKRLDSQIRWLPPMPPHGRDPYQRSRNLIMSEWEQVVWSVQTYHFPCRIHDGRYVFCLRVHDLEPPDKQSPLLLEIAFGQLPWASARQGETLDRISVLTHTPANAAALKKHGFDPLKELSKYRY